MLSHLRKWFRPHSAQSAPRNRIGAPRFRGQFERLEVRTVLSASIGTSVVDFETGHSGLWESVVTAQKASLTGISSFAAVTAAHWEDSPSSGLSNRHISPESYEAVNGAGGNGGQLTLLISKPVDAVLVVTVRRWAPPRMGWEAAFTPSSKPPIAATSPVPTLQYEWPSEPSRNVQYPVATIDSFPPLLPTLFNSTDNQTSMLASNVRERDSAFHSNSTEALLLAASLGDYYDADSDRAGVDNWRDNAEEDEGILAGLYDSSLDGDEVSLDAFQQECTALDAVFAELNDVEMQNENSRVNAAEYNPIPNVVRRYEIQIEAPWAVTNAVPSAHRDVVHGGMVLLEPSGDSKHSAEDLIEIVTESLLKTTDVPISVEASIGIYQAFDVGANEMRPSLNDSAPPVAPAADGRSSAAAEHVSAKRTEQPS